MDVEDLNEGDKVRYTDDLNLEYTYEVVEIDEEQGDVDLRRINPITVDLETMASERFQKMED